MLDRPRPRCRRHLPGRTPAVLTAIGLVLAVLVPAAGPAAAAVNGVSEYEIPTSNAAVSYVTAGPDGAMWFAEQSGNKIGRMTSDGDVTEYVLPTAGSQPLDIVTGPDGNLWFTEFGNSAIGRITPAGVLTEFPLPAADLQPFGITVGPDGNLWFTEFNNSTIGKITTAGVVTEYQPGGCSEHPTGIISGPVGKLWYVARGCSSVIGSIATDGTPGAQYEYSGYAEPYDLAVGPDGNLWVAEYAQGVIARFTPEGERTEFTPPTAGSNPYGITAGPDGNLWFTEAGSNRIGRMNTSGVAVEYSLPVPAANPYGITTGVDNRLWFGQPTAAYIGALDPATAAPIPVVTEVSPDHGPPEGGTAVVITGTGFAAATNVRFTLSWISKDAASFTVNSDTQITAVTPELYSGFNWDVIVDSPAGSSTAVPDQQFLTVGELGLSSIDPASGSPLGGTTVRVFGSGLAAATEVDFGGVRGTDLLIGSDNDLTVTAPAGTNHTTVDVTVKSPYGASAVVPEGEYSFAYDPIPRQIVPDSGPAAGGTSVEINGDGFLGATGVKFGDTTLSCPAQCVVNNSNQILLVTPPHAVAGVRVTVISPDGPSITGPTFAYTGIGAFTPTAPCVEHCGQSGAVVLPSGKILALSIHTTNIYDPATDVWTKGADCIDCDAGRVGASLTLLTGTPAQCGTNCGKVLFIGFDKAALYDPVVDTWTSTGALVNTGFSYGTGTLLKNGKVLDVRNKVAQLYNPLTNTFTATGALNNQRNSHAASLMNDGRVLVTGGGGQTGPRPFSNLAEIYDPTSGTWSNTGSMAQARFAHASTTLPDGRVLVTGGQIGFVAPIKSSEIFDPATGTWSPTANMVFARSDHDAALLPDGRVFVIGGDEPTEEPATRNPIGHNPTIAEVFDPATQGWLPAAPTNLSLDNNGVFGQSHNVRLVVLPPGPASACKTHCGQVMAVRTLDFDAPVYIPTAVLFAVPPRATVSSPASGLTDGGTVVTITGTGLASVSSVTFGGTPAASVTPDPTTPDTKLVAVSPAHSAGAVDVAVTTAGGSVVAGKFTFQAPPAPPPFVNPTSTGAPQIGVLPTLIQPTTPAGYAMAAADGGVFSFGSLPFAGSLGGARPNQPIAAIEHTPSGKGYWLVGADGGVFAFGDAPFKGSTGGIRLAKPIVDIVGTPSGNGYFLIGSDGGVFAFGDAAFKGSTGALKLNQPIVAAERSKTGNGYWLIASDGGVFAFGDAAFKGSTGAIKLAQPVVSVARSAGGAGYWLIASDGGVFAFGDAVFHGSTGAIRLNSPIVGAAAPATGSGYVLCAKDGGAFAFGAAGFAGSLGATRLNSPITSCSGPRPAAT